MEEIMQDEGRPAGLPDFATPPVTEVVVGLQFNALPKFLAPHLGLIWQEFRNEFPEIEERPALPPVFETFAQSPQVGLNFNVQIGQMGGMPRILFMNLEKSELLQVQRDRFVHNWRKIGDAHDYPRFEHVLLTFETNLLKLDDLFKRFNLGTIVPNQCEIAYINQIEVADTDGAFNALRQVFSNVTDSLVLDELGDPEDSRFSLRYEIKNSDGVPHGRLIVDAEPARRWDGRTIINFSLAVRGVPNSPDFASVVEFLKIGRIHIVKAFAKLTSNVMHKKWERQQ